MRHKETWIYPDSTTINQIDQVNGNKENPSKWRNCEKLRKKTTTERKTK